MFAHFSLCFFVAFSAIVFLNTSRAETVVTSSATGDVVLKKNMTPKQSSGIRQLEKSSEKEAETEDLEQVELALNLLKKNSYEAMLEDTDELRQLVMLRTVSSPVELSFLLPALVSIFDEQLFLLNFELPNYMHARKYSLFNVWNVFFDSAIMPENVSFFLESNFIPLSMRSAFIHSLERRTIKVKDEIELGFEVKM